MTDTPRFCEQCGSPLGEGVAFCESCGAPAPVATAPGAAPVAGHGAPRWIPLVIGLVGVLLIVASIVSAR